VYYNLHAPLVTYAKLLTALMIIGFNSESLLLSFSLICAVKLSEYQSAIELDFYGHPYEALRILVIDVSLF
jgi:hypothetical protein